MIATTTQTQTQTTARARRGRRLAAETPEEKQKHLRVLAARLVYGLSVRAVARLYDCSERSVEWWSRLARDYPEGASLESLRAWYSALSPRRRALILSPRD